jgi:hypothetical protein
MGNYLNMMWKEAVVILSQHMPERIERKHETLNQNMLSPDLNPRASK